MNKEILEKLHTHMFDGEGDGAAASTSTEGGTESNAEPTVVYGKAEAGEEESQVGSDDTAAGSQQGETDIEAEFEQLIKGQYAQQFNNRVQGIMQQRFKNAQDSQAIIDDYARATAPLYAMYGVNPGDIKGLEAAIANDESLYATRAEEAGYATAKQYRENLRLQMEAAQGRSMREEMQRQAEKQQTFNRWELEAAELKNSYPGFDLMHELDNPDFSDKLNRGYSVRDAFFTAHMGDILSGAMGEAKNAATQQVVNNFRARQARPAENAASQASAVIRKTDPSKWTDKDFAEVEKRVMNGEKIRL